MYLSYSYSVSDGGFLALLLLQQESYPIVKNVTTLETSLLSQKLLNKLAVINNVANRLSIVTSPIADLSEIDVGKQADVKLFVGEPYFYSNILPWHGLYFWFARQAATHLISPSCRTIPCGAILRGMCVQFSYLHTTRAKVGFLAGFNLQHFDDLFADLDDTEESKYTWQYEHRPLTTEMDLMMFNFTQSVASLDCN